MQEKEPLAPFLMLSLLAHILFLGGALWFSSRYDRALPAGTDAIMIEFMGEISESSPVVAPPPPITKEPVPVPEETPLTPVADEPVADDTVALPDPEKKIVPEKPKEKAPVVVKRSKINERKKAPDEKADRSSVNASLAEIARNVAKQETTQKDSNGTATTHGARGNSGADRGVNDYRNRVASKVQQNWAHAGGGASDGSVVIAFRVNRNGRLQFQSLKVQESIKGSDLIESARRAILKSDPFPPFPDEIKDSEVIVLLRFTYQGVGI